jgi:hypothetical protein
MLRSLVIAEKNGLAVAGVPCGGRQRQRAQLDFISRLLQLEGGRRSVPAANANQAPPSTCLQLLWSLVLRAASAGCPMPRRAAALLLWCLAPPLPHITSLLAPAAVSSLASLGAVRRLAASAYRQVRPCRTAADPLHLAKKSQQPAACCLLPAALRRLWFQQR